MTIKADYQALMDALEYARPFVWDGVSSMDIKNRAGRYPQAYVCHAISESIPYPRSPYMLWVETKLHSFIEDWLAKHGAVTYEMYLCKNRMASIDDHRTIQRERHAWVAELVELFREMRDTAPDDEVAWQA